MPCKPRMKVYPQPLFGIPNIYPNILDLLTLKKFCKKNNNKLELSYMYKRDL